MIHIFDERLQPQSQSEGGTPTYETARKRTKRHTLSSFLAIKTLPAYLNSSREDFLALKVMITHRRYSINVHLFPSSFISSVTDTISLLYNGTWFCSAPHPVRSRRVYTQGVDCRLV